ncbi:alpha-(1,3)-fucosyltransferase fut-6-like, partial [Centruroides sculpturatus]|uniref:alpha-(1,3)-fucosyltransferase fut-6-like n=1 Tax=Centruroides sculpturatus TaxID=218467 RepID=UPI000C6EEB4F
TQFQFPISFERQKEFIVQNISEFNQKKNTPKLIYLATKYYGKDWSKSYYYFDKLSNPFVDNGCIVNNCRVTRNKNNLNVSDAVLFHARDIEMEAISINRRSDQIWIFYTLEPPWLELVDLKKLNNVFNWTMTYRQDSDVVVKYGIKKRTDRHTPVLTIWEGRKNAALWYVSNCCTQSGREEYVQLLREFFPIDIIGGCGKEACRPANSARCYKKMKKYKFYLSFENAICKHYVTEKFYQILRYDIIPIVMGDGEYYSTIAPPDSYINAMNYPNPVDLASYLWKISENKSLYHSFFSWKNHYEIVLHPWMCSLCEKLQSKGNVSIVKHLKHWWEDEARCKKWTLSGFLPVNSVMFPCYHTHNL